MDRKELNIYTASSVGIDYFFFLTKTISETGYNTQPVYLISEEAYRKLAKSSSISKIWLRIQMYIVYPLYLIYKGFLSKPGSIFIVSSNTFFAPYLVHFCLRFRGIKVIHMLYDLFPDALEIAGAIKQQSFLSRIIGRITKKSQSTCEGTVYLGEFLKSHAEARWGKPQVSEVIDISTDLSLYKNSFNALPDTGKIIIHYGGQLGHLHDANSIIEAIKYVCKSDIATKFEFNFYVSGAQAGFLENSLKEYPVSIISAVPSIQWREDIQNFHIGLVSLSPGGASVCLPSKTYAMMAGGMAILAICPEWSDLGVLVKSLNAGWVINNSRSKVAKELYGNNYLINIKEERQIDEIIQEFYLCLKTILENRELLEQKRKNSYQGVREKFNIESLSKKWEHVISEIESK